MFVLQKKTLYNLQTVYYKYNKKWYRVLEILIQLFQIQIYEPIQRDPNYVTWSLKDWTEMIFTNKSRVCVEVTEKAAG